MQQKDVEPWVEELLREDSEAPRMTDKQARIVASAIEIFAEKGFAGSSTSEIAQRAGVAEGTIFRHYKTKKDLLISIVTPTLFKLIAPFVIREFGDVLKGRFDSYEEFLRAMIENRIVFASKNKRLLRIFIQEVPFHPELQTQFKEIIFSQVMTRLSETVRKFQTGGQLVSLPPATILRLTASVIMGYIVSRSLLQEQEDWDDEAEREATISFIVRGLKPSAE